MDTDDVVLFVSRVLGEERLANALLREEERVRREKIEQYVGNMCVYVCVALLRPCGLVME